MPTLLQINVSLNSESTGRIVEQIGLKAISAGWISYVAYGRAYNESKSVPIKICNKFEIILHGINSLLFDNHGFSSTIATKKLIKKIKQIKPDIIHLHNIHGYYINIEILFNFLKDSHIPVVWTLHDCWAYTGHCSYYSDIQCNKWETGCNNCPKRGNYPKSLIVDNSSKNYIRKRNLFNSIDNLTLVPVSGWLGHEVEKSFFKGKRIFPILNGVDVNTFFPNNNVTDLIQRYRLYNKYILLGVATAWGERKGIYDYAKLSELLSDNYKIVMIGLTEKQSKSLPNNILKLKRTENVKELAEWYSLATLVLNLSSQESFGLTTVEGFASGTPCVAYNCTASPELITSETGAVVAKGDVNALIMAINKISNNGKNYYAENCRKRALECFNMEIQYNKYLKLYDSLLYDRLSNI